MNPWDIVINQFDGYKTSETAAKRECPKSVATTCTGVYGRGSKFAAMGNGPNRTTIHLYFGDSFEAAVQARKEWEIEAAKKGMKFRHK